MASALTATMSVPGTQPETATKMSLRILVTGRAAAEYEIASRAQCLRDAQLLLDDASTRETQSALNISLNIR